MLQNKQKIENLRVYYVQINLLDKVFYLILFFSFMQLVQNDFQCCYMKGGLVLFYIKFGSIDVILCSFFFQIKVFLQFEENDFRGFSKFDRVRIVFLKI